MEVVGEQWALFRPTGDVDDAGQGVGRSGAGDEWEEEVEAAHAGVYGDRGDLVDPFGSDCGDDKIR